MPKVNRDLGMNEFYYVFWWPTGFLLFADRQNPDTNKDDFKSFAASNVLNLFGARHETYFDKPKQY